MPHYHDEWKSGEPTTSGQYWASQNTDRADFEKEDDRGDFPGGIIILLIGIGIAFAAFHYIVIPMIH